jgi:large subunit ribosomal protein L15
MRLEDLRPAEGSRHRRKRIGRGPSSGQGKTAGKGHKGQKARSGGGKTGGFEGGQMPLYRRLPKRGFLPHGGKTRYAVVNVKDLARFTAGSVVDPEALAAARLIRNHDRGAVKLLAEGDLEQAVTVRVHAASESARAKVEAKGGRVELIEEQSAAGREQAAAGPEQATS